MEIGLVLVVFVAEFHLASLKIIKRSNNFRLFNAVDFDGIYALKNTSLHGPRFEIKKMCLPPVHLYDRLIFNPEGNYDAPLMFK